MVFPVQDEIASGRERPRNDSLNSYQETADFVSGDPTEIERPQAWKTPYVRNLKGGKGESSGR